MRRLTLAFATVTVLISLLPTTTASSADELKISGTVTAPPHRPPSIEITVGATHQRERVLSESVTLFRDNDLILPDIDVQFFDDPADCQGYRGLFIDETTPKRILVCSELAFVLPHELAHAWSSLNLDDADRNRYVVARGLSTWDDHTVAWGDRGTEDAAFIIQQNLWARNARPESSEWQRRMVAYEQLTGRASPLSENRPSDNRPSENHLSDSSSVAAS